MFHNGNRMIALVAICASVVAVSIAIIAYSVSRTVRDQESVNTQVCQGFNKFNLVITATLQRSRVNIPKLTYFKEHPDELADQLEAINLQLKQFSQKPC